MLSDLLALAGSSRLFLFPGVTGRSSGFGRLALQLQQDAPTRTQLLGADAAR